MSFFLSDSFETNFKDKWLLWDTCALIRATDCDAEGLFDFMHEIIAENVTIKPVILELNATTDQKMSLKRADYIQRYMGTILKTNIDSLHDKTIDIQEALPRNSQPKAVDLMLASTLLQYGSTKRMIFVTENIKDFPEPIFKKEGFIMVSNESKSYGLTLLSIDANQLR